VSINGEAEDCSHWCNANKHPHATRKRRCEGRPSTSVANCAFLAELQKARAITRGDE